MYPFGEEDILRLLQPLPLVPTTFKCGGSHQPIDRLCTRIGCVYLSACCSQRDCETCRLHESCSFIETTQVEARLEFKRKAITDILRAENYLNKRISDSRNLLIRRLKDSLPYKTAFDPFFFQRDPNRLKGTQLGYFLHGFSQKDQIKNAQQRIVKFKKEGDQLVRQLNHLRKGVIEKLIDINSMPSLQKGSEILLRDKNGSAKAEYLLKQLGNPTQLKLLFRASYHSFSAAQFHKRCDNIPNTVTIVRNEFDRTLAAYTPLKWQATAEGTSIRDPNRESFILQLDLKEKMTLIQGEENRAIVNHKDYGPIFGGGNDLAIANQCNLDKTSYAKFPTSYNYKTKYERNQEVSNLFTGDRKGNGFRVFEYEVFQVIK